jgi:type IV secretion system protein VirD4
MASSEGTNTGTSGKAFETGSRSRGSNTTFHEVSRPLIRKSEIMQDMRDDDMIVLPRSSPPLRCGRAIYFRRPELNEQVGENKFYKKTKFLLPMRD